MKSYQTKFGLRELRRRLGNALELNAALGHYLKYYSPRAPPAGGGGASVVRGISQSCAGETFGYAAQERSQRSQTCRVDAPWYGTRAMQVTTSRGQNCARRALFCVSALCPLAPTPFDEISRNLVHGYSSTRAFKICIS